MTELNIQNGVLIGHNDELYLAHGAHKILDFATGASSVSAQSVRNFAQNVAQRSAFCQKRSIPFLQIVAPEKYRVQTEGWPIEGQRSFWDAHDDFSGQPVWYGTEDHANNPYGRSYLKTDTHWSAAGMILATIKIAQTAGFSKVEMDQLQTSLQNHTKPLKQKFYGDLGRKLDPKQGEDVEWPHLAHTIEQCENGVSHQYGAAVNDGRMVFLRNIGAVTSKKLLIFGDSYLFNALRYLALGFQEVVFCRTRFFHRELVVMSHPDVIIAQAAERYTRVVSHDKKAPPFLLLPFVLGRKVEMSPKDAAFMSSFLADRREPDFRDYGLDFGQDDGEQGQE